MTYLNQKDSAHLVNELAHVFRFPLTDLSTPSSEEVTSKDKKKKISSVVLIYF